MEDCLKVLEAEPFMKMKKQRRSAWKGNGSPPVHTYDLGAHTNAVLVSESPMKQGDKMV